MPSPSKSLLRELDRAYHRLPFQPKEVERVERSPGTKPLSYAEVSDTTNIPGAESTGGNSAAKLSDGKVKHSIRPKLYTDLSYNTVTEEFVYHPDGVAATRETQQDDASSNGSTCAGSTCVDTDSDGFPDSDDMSALEISGQNKKHGQAPAFSRLPSFKSPKGIATKLSKKPSS